MTSIRPLNRDHIVISLSPGYIAVTFRTSDGGAEAVILDKSGTECTRFAIAAPGPDQIMEIRNADDRVEVLYRKRD